MKITRGIALAAAAAMSLTTLAACGSDTAQDEETPDSLSFWYYEEDDAGQTQAWRRAAEAFEKETGVKINFERKSFTQQTVFVTHESQVFAITQLHIPTYCAGNEIHYERKPVRRVVKQRSE